MCSNDDILQIIPDEDLPKLMEIYKDRQPEASYIYNYLGSVIRWKQLRPDKNYITIMAPHGQWGDGTFVAIHQFHCNELFLFTLEKNCEKLCGALRETKRIDWTKGILLYSIYNNYFSSVLKTIKERCFDDTDHDLCGIWWLPKEKAKNFEVVCPPEVYMKELTPEDALVINQYWPPRYQDSDKYLATLIGLNGGFGIYLKDTHELVAWVIRNLLGLGALFTIEEHRRKGYAVSLIQMLSKDMAEKGFNPLGTVRTDNEPSEEMFKKLGFEMVERVVYCENRQFRYVQ